MFVIRLDGRDTDELTRQFDMTIVASGDYLHTMGAETPTNMGFRAYDAAADRIALRFLPSAPQTDAVPGDAMRGADALLMLGQYLRAADIESAADTLTLVARAGVGVDKIDIAACTRAFHSPCRPLKTRSSAPSSKRKTLAR